MCRWIAYSGSLILLEELLYKPKHSLIDQSLHARLGVETANGVKCAEVDSSLAAFVLGGLEPEEAAEVEGHLTYCPGCRDEQAKSRSCPASRSRLETTTHHTLLIAEGHVDDH